MKDRDKKSFPGNTMVQKGLVTTLNKDRNNYYKHMFQNYTYGMVSGVAVCVNLKESWENGICCLDFDGVEWFFKNKHFNEHQNKKIKNFLKFLLLIKKGGFLIFSSMTNTPFDRFKIFFKIKNNFKIKPSESPKSIWY
uniref:hypothetical protein n=1 Tax=Ulva meridionalis TaxID=434723 RepID=UPI0028E0A207|nr:hypothetical protein NQY40_pgp082 [Ulva meridionalis]WFS80029.1 hypothetical protein [Ulva meridionalis]